MIKKGIVFLVLFLVFIAAMSFAQEGRKGIRIKETKGNAGKRWAICIGINDYEDNSIIDLKKARNDAIELGKVLKEYGQFDRVYVMTDDLNPRGEDYPKLMNIRRKMDFLKGFIDAEDLVLFSFSGHGIANSEGEGYLVTADSYREDFQGSSLKVKEIIEWLKEVKVKKSLLLLDACREKFQEGKAINLNGLKAERFLQAEVGAVFYSTKSGWFSYEEKEGDFGVFTRYVIDGLKGGADSTQIAGNGDGIVTFLELASFVEEGVSNWALNKGKKQRPYIGIFGEKYGDLALSAYIKTGDQEKKDEEIKEQVISEVKPEDVKVVESKGIPVNRNETGYWEADYGDGIIMVYIPEGEFTMGSNDGNDDERPLHKVYLDGYWMGKTEVTVGQYKTFISETGHRFLPGSVYKYSPGDNHPAIGVSWDDANSYCKWLSKKTGLRFKLPTEAQWEKAARGTDRRKYPWGNHEPYYRDKWYANYATHDSLGKRGKDGFQFTAPVDSYPQGASPYGILNMAGNVWEWCNDWYGSDYYKESTYINPMGPTAGPNRVVRGGGWNFYAENIRCTNRFDFEPSYLNRPVGFRLCQDNK